ncbi:MAG: acyltransferase [Xanthobacteraceae bacterium]
MIDYGFPVRGEKLDERAASIAEARVANEPRRLEYLDGLRGFAALTVVFYHTTLCFDRALASGASLEAHFGWELLLANTPLMLLIRGSLPVMVFFCLSGYVLAGFVFRSRLGLLPQLLRRYIRFALPITAACLLSYLLLKTLAVPPGLHEITKSTWLAAVYQQNVGGREALFEGVWGALLGLIPQDQSYDPVLWTMVIEFWGSILLFTVFALVGAFLTEQRRRLALLFVFSLCALIGYSSYLGVFCFGAALALVRKQIPLRWQAAGSLLGLGLLFGTAPWSGQLWPGYDLPMVPLVGILPFPFPGLIDFYAGVGGCLILIAATRWEGLQKVLSTSLAKFLGEISFPLYLVHLPLLVTVTSSMAVLLAANGASYGVLLVSAYSIELIVSIGTATAFLRLIERPTIRLSRIAGNLLQRALRWMIEAWMIKV